MKLSITKEQLLNGLQAVQNIVSVRTTLPILSNVLLHAEDQRLRLTATDLDVTISATVEAQVSRQGAGTVPVKKLFGIVRELGAGELEMEGDDKQALHLRSGASYYRIMGLGPEEFPPLVTFSEAKQVTLAQDKVRAMLRKTSYAMSTDESRFMLNGIFFSIKPEKVTLVATDGRRLALAEQEFEAPVTQTMEFIVPTKTINELNRLLQPTGTLEIQATENQAAFRLLDEKGLSILLISKLVEGNYPNYRQVIPAEAKERVTIVREELLQALRRAEIMTSEKANSVKLSFTKNNLAITANAPDVGEARESIAVNYKGRDLAIAFNPVYMMDPLKTLDEDEIFLELIDDLSPGVIKTNTPFLYVLMPMRMSS